MFQQHFKLMTSIQETAADSSFYFQHFLNDNSKVAFCALFCVMLQKRTTKYNASNLMIIGCIFSIVMGMGYIFNVKEGFEVSKYPTH